MAIVFGVAGIAVLFAVGYIVGKHLRRPRMEVVEARIDSDNLGLKLDVTRQAKASGRVRVGDLIPEELACCGEDLRIVLRYTLDRREYEVLSSDYITVGVMPPGGLRASNVSNPPTFVSPHARFYSNRSDITERIRRLQGPIGDYGAFMTGGRARFKVAWITGGAPLHAVIVETDTPEIRTFDADEYVTVIQTWKSRTP